MATKLTHISVEDNYKFAREEAMERCFSPYGIGPRRSVADTGDGCYAWFPKAEYRDKYGKIQSAAEGSNWKNHFKKNGDVIISWLYEGEPATDTGTEPRIDRYPDPLHCFWNDEPKNARYTYKGTYQCDLNASKLRYKIYRRLRTDIDLTRWCYYGGDFSYIDYSKEGNAVYKNIYIQKSFTKQLKKVEEFKQNAYESTLREEKQLLQMTQNVKDYALTEDSLKLYLNNLAGKLGCSLNRLMPDDISANEIGSFLMSVILLENDENNTHNDIIRNCFYGQELTGKILALYYPERYFLYSLSEEETEYYLTKLNLSFLPNDDLTEKHCLLYFWKQCNYITMEEWSPYVFYGFLKYTFGKSPDVATTINIVTHENDEIEDTSERSNDDIFDYSDDDLGGNIAIKSNFCDGGIDTNGIGFAGVCSDKMIRYNIEEKKRAWCSNTRCPCYQYHKGWMTRLDLIDKMKQEGDFVCYESTMLTKWMTQAGLFEDGRTKKFSDRIHTGAVCVLTTRKPEHEEKERYIFALFLIDKLYRGDDQKAGYVKCNSKYKICLTPEEIGIMQFWNYHSNKKNSKEERWGTGLYRYLSNDSIERILQDLIAIRDGKEKNEAIDFYEEFLRLNAPERLDSVPERDSLNCITSIQINSIPKAEIVESEQEEEAVVLSIENLIVSKSELGVFEYNPRPEKRKEVEETSGKKNWTYPRDAQKRINALIRSNYKCECDNAHCSFISKKTDKPYMETHHIVPLEYWPLFENSLDVEANIVSLCSNCHNEIHYGKNGNALALMLYNAREKELSEAGIVVSAEQLEAMYDHKRDF